MNNQKHFLPAAGHDFFLPLYDPFVRWMGFDRVRQDLVDQANIKPDHHLLDIGCGTGTLVVHLKRLYPAAQVFGLDPDPKALQRAKVKAQRAGVAVNFEQGFADRLPYEANSFDRVFSSFMFHHLEGDDREKTLREVLRVLKPGGSFHLVDFTADDGSGGFFQRLVHSHAETKHNSDERILQLMNRAGFTRTEKVKSGSMVFGLMKTGQYQASRR
ncbi:MAG TPA: class I SAM-dependent methyltransferase [Pyrinomonadaceae bacterium]|nr:class I SAM-dependent methyltransferase [Pyrinomonadaceae bacterium]